MIARRPAPDTLPARIVSTLATFYISRGPLREVILGESFDVSSLLDEFRDEARGQLDTLDAALLKLEREGAISDGERAALLRALHTLKGNSSMLGFVPLRDYLHGVESLLRTPPDGWPQALVDRLFEGAAALRRAVEQVGTDEEAEALTRLQALAAPAAAPAASGASSSRAGLAPPSDDDAGRIELTTGTDLLRVPFAKLDSLANLVADLLGTHAALDDVLATHRAELDAVGLRRPLQNRIERLEQTASALRAAVTDLRLVPVRRVFDRFPRLIRELAREQGKRIRVEVEGEETELDKSTVDALAEPLLHLVRNAVDHGIRAPADREAQGRPAEGRIALRAAQAGDTVRIEVEDDGTGLDRDGILARAREAGLLAPDEAPAPEEVGRLIFRPGFSTRSEASTVSGRGIGLDIVAESVARLRGSLEVEDDPGQGTRFVLHLPLTVAILPVLLFEAAGETLALPALEVEDTRRLGEVSRAAGAEVIVGADDEVVPLARPARLFRWPAGLAPPGAEAERGTGNGGYAMVVRRGGRAIAIAADRVLDQRDVLVRALPEYLGTPPGVSGATIAPDGRVILVLDAGGIMQLNLESQRRTPRVATASQDPDR